MVTDQIEPLRSLEPEAILEKVNELIREINRDVKDWGTPLEKVAITTPAQVDGLAEKLNEVIDHIQGEK